MQLINVQEFNSSFLTSYPALNSISSLFPYMQDIYVYFSINFKHLAWPFILSRTLEVFSFLDLSYREQFSAIFCYYEVGCEVKWNGKYFLPNNIFVLSATPSWIDILLDFTAHFLRTENCSTFFQAAQNAISSCLHGNAFIITKRQRGGGNHPSSFIHF